MIKVYLSSTRLDLENERRVVLEWLADNGYERRHSYVADTETVRDSCIADVQASDVYVLILGHRRGFVPEDANPEGRSITELEYEAAIGKKLPIVVMSPTYVGNVALTDIGRPEVYAKVLAFRERVNGAHRPAEVKDLTELVSALGAALKRAGEQQALAWKWPLAWDAGAYAADKRAHFTGRAWLFDEIESWLARPVPRDLLLRADFGVGKTAFIAELAARDRARSEDQRRVLAVHYCQHDTRETLRAATFVRSLAAQIAQALPAYQAAVEASALAREQLDRAADDPGSAFEAGLINPLAALAEPAAPRMVIVDALDESLEADEADRRRASIVQLLADKAGRLPAWIRLLVTSRNNPAVVERLRFSFAPREIDGEAQLNLDDIAAYALARCATAPLAGLLAAQHIEPSRIAAELRSKSGGKFLYAVRVFDDLLAGRMQLDRLELLPAGIEAFYQSTFDRRFAQAGRSYAEAARLLAVMSAAREPMAPDALAEILDLDAHPLKALRSETLPDLIRVRDGCWAFDHASLREWLCREDAQGNAQAGPYAADLGRARRALAAWAARKVEANANTAPLHALRHLPAYLSASGQGTEVARLLARWSWLDAKLQRCGPAAMLADFAFAPPEPDLELIARVLAQCTHVLLEAPEQLAGQLLGRVRIEAAPGLAPLLAACRDRPASPWLRPLVPSLPPPGHLSRVLRGHGDIIQSCDFSADGAWLLSASADGTARLWHAGGDSAALLDSGGGALNQAVFSHDGQWIVTTHEAGGARLWTRAGSFVRLFDTGTAAAIRAAFSPDDRLLLVGCRDQVARLWQVDGKPLAVLTGHGKRLVDVGFSPDGQQLVTTSTDRTARLWQLDGAPVAVLEGHREMVARAVFSPDGNSILTASSDHTARLWQRDGRPIATLEGHTGAVNHAAFSPDGSLIATASNDNSARLWRADAGMVTVLQGHGGWVNHLSFSPDGSQLVTGSCDNTARLWNTSDGALLAVLRGHTGWVVNTAFSPDGRTIVTGANDCSLRLWRLWRHPAANLPGLPRHDGRVNSVAMDAATASVLSTSEDGQARLWSTVGAPQRRWRAHEHRITQGEFLSGGRCVTASSDATARLWDVAGSLLATLTGHDSTINAVRGSPDGQLLATGANDGSLRLWSPDGRCLAVLKGHADAVNDIAFSPDGRRLASASNDAQVGLWTTAGERVALLEGHGGWVLDVEFSADGEHLLSCAEDGSVRLWRADGRLIAELTGHHDAVVAGRFLVASQQVATASRDRSVRIWTLDGQPLATLTGHTAPLTALALDSKSGALVSADAAGVVRVWRDLRALAALNVDAPIAALGVHGGRIVCGDSMGGVHFIELVDATGAPPR